MCFETVFVEEVRIGKTQFYDLTHTDSFGINGESAGKMSER